MTIITTALFAPGQMVRHKEDGYRGLIYDVDPKFRQETTWLEKVEAIDSAANLPWYHVLVDGEDHACYVSEDNLEPASRLDERIEFSHPLLNNFFEKPNTDAISARRNIN